jgi:hypothetical protein
MSSEVTASGGLNARNIGAVILGKLNSLKAAPCPLTALQRVPCFEKIVASLAPKDVAPTAK